MSEDVSPGSEALTRLVLELFKFNAVLVSTGDTLVADLGLSNARWQVMGNIALSPEPLAVSGLAKAMGLSRQAVQRVADDLEREGLVVYAPNPGHRRAKLVLLSPAGERAYSAAVERWNQRTERIVQRLDAGSIEAAAGLLKVLKERLQADEAPAPAAT